jgi:hypothetical protein
MEKCLVSGVFLGVVGWFLDLMQGTISVFCSRYNIEVLYLERFRGSVPGTIPAFCAWLNTDILCLAQYPHSVPGTGTVVINGA